MPDLMAELATLEEKLLRLRPLGLITDVDGVLAEIAPSAEEAKITPQCKKYLRELSQRLEVVAIVSGRSVEVVRRMVGLEGIEYFGNNGVEHWRNGVISLVPGAEKYRHTVAEAIRELGPTLASYRVLLEDKGVGIAFHFIQSPDMEAARAATLRAVRETEAAKTMEVGITRRVIELRPPVAFNKGDAARKVIAEHRLVGAIYLGDDLPDLDAFLAIRELADGQGTGGAAVLVDNPSAPSEVVEAVHYFLESVSDVGLFLKWLSSRRLAGPQRSPLMESSDTS